MRNDKDLNKLIRYLAYVLELLVLFMLQETPGLLPSIFGARPVLLFPAVVAIAMLEPEVPALLFGVVGGCSAILASLACWVPRPGAGGAVLFISLVIRTYLQNNMATAILTGVWSIGLVVLAQWFFLYFFQYSYPAYALTHHYLPKYFYTLLFLPLLYLLNRGLSQALGRAGEGDPVM